MAGSFLAATDFRAEMVSFPCLFDVAGEKKPGRRRMVERKDKLLLLLDEGCDNASDDMIKIENTTTRLFFVLGDHRRAKDMNESVLIKTRYENIVALGNFLFMEWLTSGRISSHHLQLLHDMREKPDFEDKVLEAKAEQAFYLAEMGNMFNQMSAIELYEEILESQNRDDWRYRLGLSYRRLAIMKGVERCSGNRFNMAICFEKAKTCFGKLVESEDKRLKALGLVNLAAQESDAKDKTERMKARIANGVATAVRLEQTSGEVYLIGADAMRDINISRCVEMFEKAVALQPRRSVCQIRLGKAYVRQSGALGREERGRKRAIREKAERHLKLAYETSNGLNVASLLELGRLYQSMNQHPKAKDTLMTPLTCRYTVSQFPVSLITGHSTFYNICTEQRNSGSGDGLRHLYLSILSSINILKEQSTVNERHALWSKLFTHNQRNADLSELNYSVGRLYNILANKYGRELRRVVDNVKRCVRGGQIGDGDCTADEVQSIRGSYTEEEALVFIELVLLRAGVCSERLRSLYVEMLTTLANRCLRDGLSIATLFFRQVFECSFGGSEAVQDEADEDEDEDPVETGPLDDVSIKVHVVLLFNESRQDGATVCEDTARGLEDAITTLFDLNVAFNPTLGGPEEEGKGQTMEEYVKKHLVDVIVILSDGDGATAQSHLDTIAPLVAERFEGNGEGRRPSLVLVRCQDEHAACLPAGLTSLPCLELGEEGDEFPNRFCLQEAQDKADGSVALTDFIHAYFHGNRQNVMKLFNHLLTRQL